MNMMVGFAVIAASVFLYFAEALARMIGIQAEDLRERMVNTARLRGAEPHDWIRDGGNLRRGDRVAG